MSMPTCPVGAVWLLTFDWHTWKKYLWLGGCHLMILFYFFLIIIVFTMFTRMKSTEKLWRSGIDGS